MASRLVQGTDESVNVRVTDASRTVNDLSGATPTFDVILVDPITQLETTAMYTAQTATANGMIIQCLIDTNHGGLWAKGKYHLYITFSIDGEVPREGPFDLLVV